MEMNNENLKTNEWPTYDEQAASNETATMTPSVWYS